MTSKKHKEFMKWVAFIAFAFMLVGSFNWLIIGFFEVDIFDEILGGSLACRIIYILFGAPSVILGAMIGCRAYKKNAQPKSRSASSSSKSAAHPTTSQTSTASSNTSSKESD